MTESDDFCPIFMSGLLDEVQQFRKLS